MLSACSVERQVSMAALDFESHFITSPIRGTRSNLVRCSAPWIHRLRSIQLPISTAGKRDECRIVFQRSKHSIHACFHHLFRPYCLIALVFEEVTFEQGKRLVALAGLCVNGGQIV